MGPLANISAIELSVPYVSTRKVDVAITETTYCPVNQSARARQKSARPGLGVRCPKIFHNGTCMVRANDLFWLFDLKVVEKLQVVAKVDVGIQLAAVARRQQSRFRELP
jgi:hypothetical protein